MRRKGGVSIGNTVSSPAAVLLRTVHIHPGLFDEEPGNQAPHGVAHEVEGLPLGMSTGTKSGPDLGKNLPDRSLGRPPP